MAKTTDELANLIAQDLKGGRQPAANPKAIIATLPKEYKQGLTETAYLKATRVARAAVLREKLQELSAANGFTSVVKAMFPDAVITVSGNRIIIEASNAAAPAK